MAIDFTLPPDVEAVRARVRDFMDSEVRPAEAKLYANASGGEPDRREVVGMIIELREKAKEWGVWLPHMPKEWGGVGLGLTAMAFVSAECGAQPASGRSSSTRRPPTRATCTRLLHYGPPEQKEHYLRPLVEGGAVLLRDDRARGGGLRPDGIQTTAVLDEWRASGSSTATSGSSPERTGRASRSSSPRPTPTPTRPRRGTPPSSSTCPPTGWKVVRDIETMAGRGNHCEIRIDEPAGARLHDPGRAWPGSPARPDPPRAGAAGALHAVDRARRAGARA